MYVNIKMHASEKNVVRANVSGAEFPYFGADEALKRHSGVRFLYFTGCHDKMGLATKIAAANSSKLQRRTEKHKIEEFHSAKPHKKSDLSSKRQ